MERSLYVSQALVRFLKIAVARGFEPVRLPPSRLNWVKVSGAARAPDFEGAAQVFVLPTYLERCSPEQHAVATTKILEQFFEGKKADLLASAKLVLAFQHAPHDADKAAAHLEQLVAAIPARFRSKLCVASIDLHGKVNALNKVIETLARSDFDGAIGWVDDDVSLGPSCLAELADYLNTHPEVMIAGARKIAIPNTQWAARVFLKTKVTARKTSRAIPHGCAILCRFTPLSEGFPQRYIGEDGYLSLKFYAPDAQDTLVQQAVVDDALCEHTVGGPLWEIIPRIRRTIHENVILLADFDLDVSARFADEILFHGFRKSQDCASEPGVRFSSRLLTSLVFSFYVSAGIGIWLRGLFGRPLRQVSWSGYSAYGHPEKDT